MQQPCTKAADTPTNKDITDTTDMQGFPDADAAAARADVPAAHQAHIAAAAVPSGLPQKPVLVDWRLLLRVMKIWQVWVLACSESVKGEREVSLRVHQRIYRICLLALLCTS